jgi:iron complex outermembrane recepter protein
VTVADAATETDEVARQQTVTVTGSRIQQTNLSSAVPVSTFNAAQIELSGAVNVADVLRQLPATGVSGISSGNSNFTTTASGINTLELRNLGEDRTLVLVNGRRFVGGVPGSSVVDFNQIPTEFIDRIDVITGGASAVYGSDALAGVVNVILKKDFEGLTFSSQAGITDADDNETYRANITAGSNFADGKGNAILSLGWSTNNGAFFRDRPGQGNDDLDYSLFTGDAADFGTLVSDLQGFPFYSSFSERGRFFGPGVGNRTVDESTGGTFRNYAGSRDGFDRQQFRAMTTPTERITAAAVINYEVSPLFNFFSEINYATTDTSSELEPFPLGGDDIYGTQPFCVDANGDAAANGSPSVVRCINGAPITGAYVPEAFRAQLRAANPGLADEDLVYGFARRTTEVNARGAENTRQTARVVAGFDGEFENGVNYEVSLNWGRTTQNQESTGGIDVRNFQQALDSIVVGGEIVCRDEVARSQGCVPINIFGAGNISPEAAAYVRADSKYDAAIEQVVFNAYLSGDTTPIGLELPAGPLSWVAGYEWREESSEELPDALSQSGLNAGNVTPITKGSYDVYEFFGELQVPLLKDAPLAKELTAKLAARQSTYSSVGDTFAWSGNLEWSPVEQIRFRGQYAEAVRAPNISEAFSGLSETFATVSDPCNGLTLVAGTPTFGTTDPDDLRIASICYADPLVAARVARDGSLTLSQPELQGTGGLVGGALAGGYDLKQEEATTFTLGFVLNPNWNSWLEPFVLSVDYFDIEITDAIGTLGRNTSLNRCYGNGDSSVTTFDPNSAFCSNVIRYSVGPFLGATDQVNSFSQNLSSIKTTGIDVQASYVLTLNDLFKTATPLGDLALSANYQYLDKYESEAFPGAGTGSSDGSLGLSQNEGLFGAVYTNGALTLAVDTTWVGSNKEDFGFLNTPIEFDDTFFTDIQVRYRLLNDTVTLVGGVDNVSDEFVYTGLGNNATGHYTDPDVYDALGRRFYVGFRLDF